ncbi:MAG: SGNH/GDSL hydrolase family protein, partial [bacterium]|nr:SGNH/GDSL hydrolase family protein [bacterium]
PPPPDFGGDPNVKQILFIGHSLTYWNDMPAMFERLTIESGEDIIFSSSSVASGGYTLKMHYYDGEAASMINNFVWDYVVIQGIIYDGVEKYMYAAHFNRLIRQNEAETVFFLPWSGQDRPENQPFITDAHYEIADTLGATVAPVGVAWQNVLEANPELPIYSPDRVHPSSLGSYLAACVFYSVFYNKSPEGLPYSFAVSADSSDISLIQRTIWETVSGLESKRK